MVEDVVNCDGVNRKDSFKNVLHSAFDELFTRYVIGDEIFHA